MAVKPGHAHPRRSALAGEQLLGQVLIVGVLLSALLVFAGGIFYLLQHGAEVVSYARFDPQAESGFHTLHGTLATLGTGASRSVIQLGLFALVLLQSLRVALCAWLFGRQRELAYVLMSVFLLAVLLHSFV